MNTVNRPTIAIPPETLQARVGLRLAALLTEQTEQAPHDVSERLRFAREQALQRARSVRAQAMAPAAALTTPIVGTGRMAATLGLSGGTPWWLRLASLMPLIVLVAGLVLIEQAHSSAQIAAAADIDAQILSDALPPAAYSDPGFAEFLKVPAE